VTSARPEGCDATEPRNRCCSRRPKRRSFLENEVSDGHERLAGPKTGMPTRLFPTCQAHWVARRGAGALDASSRSSLRRRILSQRDCVTRTRDLQSSDRGRRAEARLTSVGNRGRWSSPESGPGRPRRVYRAGLDRR